MRAMRSILSSLVFVVACGGQEAESTSESDPSVAPSGAAESRPVDPPQPDGNPCAPLDAKMVRYDTEGNPFFFSFEIPEGFTVDEFYGPAISGADITAAEYVLRIVQNSGTNDNPDRLVEIWRKLPLTDVIEKEIDGRTMHVQRTKMGELVGYNALFPDFESSRGAHLVIGGVTDAPKPCGEQAAEAVERIIMSFEKNSRVGDQPGGMS